MSELLPENPDEPDEEVRAEAEESRGTQPENSSLQRQISASIEFTGLLPPLIALEHYNRILPGAANRILSMAFSVHCPAQIIHNAKVQQVETEPVIGDELLSFV